MTASFSPLLPATSSRSKTGCRRGYPFYTFDATEEKKEAAQRSTRQFLLTTSAEQGLFIKCTSPASVKLKSSPCTHPNTNQNPLIGYSPTNTQPQSQWEAAILATRIGRCHTGVGRCAAVLLARATHLLLASRAVIFERHKWVASGFVGGPYAPTTVAVGRCPLSQQRAIRVLVC